MLSNVKFNKFAIHLFQPMYICQIRHIIFESISPFSFKFCINLQRYQNNSSALFLAQKLYTLVKGAN